MICNDCGSENITYFSEDDEYGHGESWYQCDDCKSDNINEEEE